jgi:hypothetical protein
MFDDVLLDAVAPEFRRQRRERRRRKDALDCGEGP